MNVLSCSFGQTSAYMLRREIDRFGFDYFDRNFLVVFENTGQEHDATLDFGYEIQRRWGVRMVWLEYCRVPASSIPPGEVPEGRKRANLLKKAANGEDAHWFRVVNYETAKRSSDPDTPFDELLRWANVLPNVRSRMCSVQLKVRTRDRYLRSCGIYEFDSYIGIRADESHRKLEIMANCDQYETPHFPLCDSGVTKQAVDLFWNNENFKLGIPNYMGNCKFCYLKARWKRKAVLREDPASIHWAAKWEEVFKSKASGDGRYFKRGESYAALIDDARQPDLLEPDIACSCAVGGYKATEDNDE